MLHVARHVGPSETIDLLITAEYAQRASRLFLNNTPPRLVSSAVRFCSDEAASMRVPALFSVRRDRAFSESTLTRHRDCIEISRGSEEPRDYRFRFFLAFLFFFPSFFSDVNVATLEKDLSLSLCRGAAERRSVKMISGGSPVRKRVTSRYGYEAGNRNAHSRIFIAISRRVFTFHSIHGRVPVSN